MRVRNFVHLSILLFFVYTSCSSEESEFVGVYVKVPSNNTIDSLFFSKDSVYSSPNPNWEFYKYEQKFYRKSGELLFVNSGLWRLDDGQLVLDNFYWNADTKPEGSFLDDALRRKVLGAYTTRVANGKIFVDKNTFYRKVKK